MAFVFGRKVLLSIGILTLLAGIGTGNAQDFLTSQSDRTATAPERVELGFVESGTGALHLEIPMAEYPQRGSGGSFPVKLVYDSTIWSINSSGVWSAPGVPSFSGWRWIPVFAPSPVQSSSTIQPPPPANGCDTQYSDFNWTDPSGVTHFFPIKTVQVFNPSSGCATDTPNGDAFATDSSGYHLYITNYLNSKLYAPDGTLVSAAPSTTHDPNGNVVTSVDTNGNYFSYFLQTLPTQGPPSAIYDTAGHTLPATSFCISPQLPTSQGTSTFQVTCAQIQVKTAFGQHNVTECSTNCFIEVIQSIKLPDNTSYTFLYDCDSTSGNAACGSPGGQAAYYGVLTSLTLPTGGQITYSYTNFSDAYGNKSRWLNSRTAGGGTWFYTPTVLTTCAPKTVGCKEKVTVTKPNSDRTEYTFILNNGAWPTEIDQFDGTSGSLLSSVFNTWDFSNNCPLTDCFGASYVRKTVEAVTLPMPGGTSITRQTTYTYDSPQTGNVTAVKEWNYAGSGGFGVFPDKAKYITYLNTGINNINRPTSVTLCSGVGSDPDCNSTGNKVAQTKTSYDSYGASTCHGQVSGLLSVTGTTNHDDTNFGTSYTARGNPTSVQRWVSGSTYLTTNYFYDTTGQVIQETDPAGNVTCNDYTDNFYVDNGQNPPQTFTPAQPTNTYLTGLTLPLIGKETYGYYAGSGKQAFFTDQNGVTTYSHFLDPLDRGTGTIFPNGWNLTTYPSVTEVDSYVGVADATASTSCTSCRHRQSIFDNLGRQVSQKIINNPGGTTNVDTAYDANGRLQSVSHAYIHPNDPTNVLEQNSYDGLDREIQTTHPDNQTLSTAFGSSVATQGGLSTQQGSTSTYGVGYPILTIDEAGKMKQRWLDGFNRVIEIDEPGGENPTSAGTASGSVIGSEESFQTLVSPAAAGSGNVQISGGVQWKTVSNASTGGTTSITIGGGEQQYPAGVIPGAGTVVISGHEQEIPATSGSGTVTINGALQSRQVLVHAATQATATIQISGEDTNSDVGNLTMTVGSASPVTISYGYLMTARTVASNLASNLSSSQVTALASGLGDDLHWQVKLTANQAGSAGNSIAFSFNESSFYPPGQYAPSFTFSPASGSLSGGTDNQYVTVYDSGTASITVNGKTFSYPFSGSGTTPTNIAAGLASQFNASSGNSVTNFVANGTPHLFSLGSDQHVYHLYWTSTIGWQVQDLTSLTGATLAGSGSALAGIFDSTSCGRVFYVGTNQHVIQLKLDTTNTWGWGDVMSMAGISTLAATGSALTTFGPAGTYHVHLLYVDTNGHINDATRIASSGAWNNTDLTATTSAAAAASGTALTSLVDNLGNARGFYLGTNQHVEQLKLDVTTNTWGWGDVMSQAGISNTAAAGSALTTFGPAGAYHVHVLYVDGSSGHINDLGRIASTGAWNNQDLTAASSATAIASGSALTSLVDNLGNARAFYEGTNQHIYQLKLDSSTLTWGAGDITSQASAANTAASRSALTSLGASGGYDMHLVYVGANQHVYDLPRTSSDTAGIWSNQELGALAVNASASASGSTVTITGLPPGTSSNYTLSSSVSYDSSNFSSASFTTSNSAATLAGGKAPLFDSGTFSATVNGHTTTPATLWSQLSTPATIASDLVAKVNQDTGAAVTAITSASAGGYRIQSSGGTTWYKYYSDFGLSQSGVAYTLQVMVRNNGTSLAQVSSNLSSVNIAPGTTQNVVLNFNGNGSSDVQLLFGTVTNVSDSLDLTVWNAYLAKVSDGVNLITSSQAFTNGPGASVTIAGDSRIPLVNRIQTSGGSTAYKYYADFGLSQSGVIYTLQTTIRNNGSAIAQVSSNLSSVNIAPGSTQNVTLNFAGNGTSNIQFLFDTVTNTSDSLDLTVWNPYVAKVSDGINLVSPAQLNFAGWTTGPGANVTVTSTPQVVLVDFIAKIKGSISNYNFGVSSTFDSSHFSAASFSNSNSGTALAGGWPNPNAVDSGTMTVTVNGHNYPVNWAQSDTPGSIATNLVSAIAADANVAPTLAGATVYLNPKQPGTAYSFATGFTYDSTDFTHSSFSPANSISDWGTMTITVNGHSDNVAWAGLSSPTTIATALAGKIDIDGAAVVTGTANGGTTGLVATTKGANTNYALASSTTFDSTNFGSSSFSTCNTNPASTGSCTSSNSVTALAGGVDAVYNTTFDSGTVTATVNGFQVSVPYQQGTTTSGLAAAVANGFNSSSSSPVTATTSGASITLTAAAGTNLTISTSASTSQPAAFGDPSFSLTLTQNVLNNGSAPGGSLSTPLATFYTYDAVDRLTQVIQGSQTRTYTYDGLGRITKETTPEAGTVTLSYTTSGGGLCSGDPDNICSMTDARGVVTNYSYDALGRILSRSYVVPQGSIVSAMPNNVCTPAGSQSQANVCMYYDQGGKPAFALGRQTKLIDPSGSEVYTYDSMGKVTQVQKTISGTTYTLGYQYNAGGDLTQITYPSGRVVQQSYNAIGQLCEVAPSTTGCATATNPFATGYSYDAEGRASSFNYGNGVSATLAFSADRAQLAGLSYKKGTQTLFSLNYLYKTDSTNCPNGAAGNNGQIQCILDNVDSGRNSSYGYDALRRLTSAVTSGSTGYPQWGLRWDYDRYGNRTGQFVTNGVAPQASVSFNQATNQVNGAVYDASGNLIVEPLSPPNDYTYDADNRMTAYSGGGGNASYTYDDHDLRVIKAVQGGTSTVYVFSGTKVVAEYDSGAAPASPSREYIYASGGEATLLATISGSTTTYNHADHLSVRLLTDGTTGQITGQEGHFPYGEAWYQVGQNNKRFFTTYERDSESGLDYALARFYDSRVGSFCSADPVEGNVEDPQSWNRYAYVGGDPVNVTDPEGQFPFAFLIFLLADLLQGMFLHGHNFLDFGSQGDGGSSFDLPFLLFMPPMIFEDNQFKQAKKAPKGTTARVRCSPYTVSVTVIGGGQAPNKGAISGKKPTVGTAAIDPRDYGLDDYYDLAHKINPQNPSVNTPEYPDSKGAFEKIQQEQRDLKHAKIVVDVQGKMPKGMPKGPYKGVDVINPPPDNPGGVDVYRTKTIGQARKLGRRNRTAVPVITPTGKVHCPK